MLEAKSKKLAFFNCINSLEESIDVQFLIISWVESEWVDANLLIEVIHKAIATTNKTKKQKVRKLAIICNIG
ncbi:hypothetical protein [Metamycoplasma equirhinis]|uniref:hypothetical protein n=1 Tax=Metamycoplasma equirhinis TaxID=92402 RepID=UPI0035935FAD